MTVKTMAVLMILLITVRVSAESLLWNANIESNVTGYRVYEGFTSRVYVATVDVGPATSLLLNPQSCGVEHFLAVTAYTVDGLESDFSEEVSYTPKCLQPAAPGAVRITVGPETNMVALEWSADLLRWDALGTFVMTNEKGFFRVVQPQITQMNADGTGAEKKHRTLNTERRTLNVERENKGVDAAAASRPVAARQVLPPSEVGK